MENEQELQGQEYQDMEGAPEGQEERVDMGMEDQEGSESLESSEQNVESVVAKLQQDFDEKFRSFQSVKDRETAELKGQLKQAIELLNNKGEQSQSQSQDITDEYFDEDGYAKEVNAKDVAKIVQDAIKKDREQQNQQYEQQNHQQIEQQREFNQWVSNQEDNSEVMDFYQKNQKDLVNKMEQQGINLNNGKEAYQFVDRLYIKNKYKQKQKPNTPPVGNQGSNYASRNPVKSKSPMQQAMENASNRTFGFRNR